jgi:outer membrane autotransporter protein
LGRYDVTEGALSGFYAEASARIGRAETDFRTSDIRYNGWNVNFESSSMYCGLHLGIGYVWKATEKASIDFSAKILWTGLEGDELTVYQDRVDFKDSDSLRARLGGRFVFAANQNVSMYVGAYWEHEFDGEAQATVNGHRLSPPSLRGDTGIGEFGLSVMPSLALPVSFDLGVQGYTGKREGISGNIRMSLAF